MANKKVDPYYYPRHFAEWRVQLTLPAEDYKTVDMALCDTAQYGKLVDVPDHLKPFYDLESGRAIAAHKAATISRKRAAAGSKGGKAKAENKTKREAEETADVDGNEDPAPVFKLPTQKEFYKGVCELLEGEGYHVPGEDIIELHRQLKENKCSVNGGASVRCLHDCAILLFGNADEINGEEVEEDKRYPSERTLTRFFFGAFDGCRNSWGTCQANELALDFLNYAKEKEDWIRAPDGTLLLPEWSDKARTFAEKQRTNDGYFYE